MEQFLTGWAFEELFLAKSSWLQCIVLMEGPRKFLLSGILRENTRNVL